MTIATSTHAASAASQIGHQRNPSRQPRRIAIALTVILVGTALGLVVAVSSGEKGPNDNKLTNIAYPTSLATVIRGTLSSETAVDATLGYAGSYDIVNDAHGTVTSLPVAGQVISQGERIYSVDGSPVVLLNGDTPAWRDLAEGAKPSDLTGPDVQELNADLVTLGYATRSQLNPNSNQFGDATKAAIKKLQAHLGMSQTGALTFGQVIFLPTAARITSISGTLGSAAQPGQPLLKATSTSHQVTIDLDAARQGQVKVGDQVTITLPNQKTTPGVVSSVGTVAVTQSGGGSSNTPTITVEVAPTDPAATGTLDQAPVSVSITTATVADALAVPVTALVAESNGSYAVEVVDAQGLHHLIDVTLGVFDDAHGLVQVISPALSAGEHVVVPAT